MPCVVAIRTNQLSLAACAGVALGDLHASVYGLQPGQPGATATSSFSLNLVNTLLHPKVMAILAVILIGTVTVWLMARPDFV